MSDERTKFVIDVDDVLESAQLKNEKVREYVRHWAGITGPDNIEVVSAADDARLIQESLDAGEIVPAGEGLYYSRSYYKDTARSEERTIVATSDPADKGVYNNWRPAAEMKAKLTGLMRGASAGKTMYVIPYLMAPPGSPLEKYAAGVQLTDNRSVVLHMIRMARVAVEYINNLADPDSFVRAVHVTGDLENLGQGTPEDKRYFVTVADERTILHFGSVLRRQRAARQDRPRSAAGRLRRLDVPPVPRRAVHAARHHRQADGQAATTSAAASRARRARPTWR